MSNGMMMNAPTEHAQELFGKALGLTDPVARRGYVDSACAGNQTLRREVESLLQAHEQAGDFLGRARQLASSDLEVEKTGVMVGRYKLLQQIGEGGFGVVYMAEQVEPVRRRVALKIIKAGMDTKEVIARFEAERQALALMDHANIARVLDAGTTQAGRPFFVMELVRGVPITEYCDANRLSIPRRIDLFRRVCLAVQHAHQKGIIHRDLKPTNILVTVQDDSPMPKIIDFGVAKALQTQLTEKTLFTRYNQWIGTPTYMSPEQASLGSLDIDTRSDIYSLGTILYELLTGNTPFDAQALREKGHDAILQTIREEDVPMPSTRLSSLSQEELLTVADHRSRPPDKLEHALKGELDWILVKALERNRTQRYETANAFAKDLERYSKGEPISAAPPGFGYQATKFLRRHRAVVPAGAAVAFLVVAVTASITWHLATRPRPFERTGEPLLATLLGHEVRVDTMDYSLERKLLVSGSVDGMINLWAAETGEKLGTLVGHKREVEAVCISPKGKLLASASDDGEIRLWHLGKRRLLSVLKPGASSDHPTIGGPKAVRDLAITPDGTMLASCEQDGQSIDFWDVKQGKVISQLETTPITVRRFELSPDGTRAVVASPDGLLALFDTTSRKQLWSQRGDLHFVVSIAFSPDGDTIATGNRDHRVRLWDVASGTLTTQLEEYLKGWGDAVAFSPDGTLLAVASDNQLSLWDLKSNAKVAVLDGHQSIITDLAFHGDGRTLSSASRSGQIKIWDIPAAMSKTVGLNTLDQATREIAAVIRSDGIVQGRYFRLLSEATSNTGYACIAELNLMDSRGTLVPRAELSVHSASSFQQVRSDGRPPRTRLPQSVLDGDPDTFWHSHWNPGPPAPFPHWIIIDLGRQRETAGFLLKNRGDGVRHSDILEWAVSISDDAESWKEVARGTFENTPEWQGSTFAALK